MSRQVCDGRYNYPLITVLLAEWYYFKTSVKSLAVRAFGELSVEQLDSQCAAASDKMYLAAHKFRSDHFITPT
jgi:hypothetical protein